MLETTFDLASSLAEVSALLVCDERLEGLLERMTRLVVDTIPPATACGITLSPDGPDGKAFTAAADSDVAGRVDEVQYGTGVGPCLESLKTGLMITSEDLRREPRWPGFSERAVELGVLSILAIPLAVREQVIGVLNLYGGEAHPYTPAELRLGELFGAQAAYTISAALRYSNQVELTQQLQTALTSRAVIDQAIGIIMAQNHCSPEQAFGVLRTASQNRNIKVRDIAARVVESAQTHDGDGRVRQPRV
jgi:GAF domain-containing protein